MNAEETQHFTTALSDLCSGYRAFRPPTRKTVAEGAADALIIKQPGGYAGPWNPHDTPYMVEPMNMLASRRHEAVAFVGPARTGKTAGLLLGWLTHNAVNDPGDMLVIQMSREKAREFSKTDVDRAMRHSPALKAMLSDRGSDSNTHDTMFRHGMWLRIGWPTVSNVSGSTYRYVAITDLDRIENAENVDGEGPLFKLALKRTTTFLSRGMCLVESSPGIEQTDPNWHPATPHEAPPTTGIIGIYNQSDRRRWYWKCPDCREWFEAAPGLSLFGLPDEEELLTVVREADLEAMSEDFGSRVLCPHCSFIIGASEKKLLNSTGRWLAEGQSLGPDDVLNGDPAASTIAGYWLGGVAAAYQSWRSLVARYLLGLRDYTLTGSEETLKATVNTDQGMPYLSRHLKETARREGPQERLDSNLERYVVPDETRLVIASVDVQGGSTARFVVQVHAVGPFMEQWLVNRFTITKSRRKGMGEDYAPIDPATYAEDWDRITEEVVRSTYRTSTEGKEIRVFRTVVDTGGESGATDKAYAWYRRLRAERMHDRVILYKGGTVKGAPMVKETFVGQRRGSERGDIPLYLCNPNLLSDAVSAGLKRREGGPGAIHFPKWLPKSFFDELNAEVRKPNGTWSQIRARNESFDLCRMIRAGMLVIGLDKIKRWERVPTWAEVLERNSEVMDADDRRDMKANVLIAPIPEAVIQEQRAQAGPRRRRAASPYLS